MRKSIRVGHIDITTLYMYSIIPWTQSILMISHSNVWTAFFSSMHGIECFSHGVMSAPVRAVRHMTSSYTLTYKCKLCIFLKVVGRLEGLPPLSTDEGQKTKFTVDNMTTTPQFGDVAKMLRMNVRTYWEQHIPEHAAIAGSERMPCICPKLQSTIISRFSYWEGCCCHRRKVLSSYKSSAVL